jgi:hypothetical protein
MTLSQEDIIEIIDHNPYADYISQCIEQYNLLRMHCTGEGIEDYVEDMPEFMREGQVKTLTKLMKGNRDLIYRTMAPRDKIYSAKGGIEQYNLPESIEPKFREFLGNIADGLPVKEWIRHKVQPRYDYDSNGVVFIEVNEYNIPFPTVRCITDIFSYMPSGRALEYIFFKVSESEKVDYIKSGLLPANLTKSDKVYRVVDDTTDRLVVTRGSRGNTTIESTVANEFGYVPAIIISDIYSYSSEHFDSPLTPAVALLDSAQLDKALFSWAYNRQAMPKEWMQKFECPTCRGEGEISGEKCPECHGKKIMQHMRNSDVAIVDYRGEGGERIPNPPMGIVASDVNGMQFMADHNASIEDNIEYTLWGVSRVQKSGVLQSKVAGHGGNVSNTAYEAQLNEQPKHDKLKLYGSWKDSIQKFIADTCGWYLYRNSYDGSAILCGDRFMIESPDATWDRYTLAVASKAPMSILDSLLMEYIENKYNNNPLLYRKYMLLMQVEPFVHEDVNVIWIDPQLPLITKLSKKYYDEWTSTITDYDIANVPNQGGADILRKQLTDWVTGKFINEKKMDSLLITGSGEVLKMGDQVQVIVGKEIKPDHQGKQFKVTDIAGSNLTLSSDDADGVFGYTTMDVIKQGAMKGLPAEPIEKLYA